MQFDQLGDVITIPLHSSLQLHTSVYCLEAAFKDEMGIAKQESRFIFSMPLAIHATADTHDELACPSIVHLSDFKEAAISSIAGFVAQMATKQLICAAYCIALGSRKGYTSSNFIKLKDRGNLFKPTSSVV